VWVGSDCDTGPAPDRDEHSRASDGDTDGIAARRHTARADADASADRHADAEACGFRG
jgi:hypothetical protein